MLEDDGVVHGRKKIAGWKIVIICAIPVGLFGYFGIRNHFAGVDKETTAIVNRLRPLPRDQWVGAIESSRDPCAVLKALGDGSILTTGEVEENNDVSYIDWQNHKPFEFIWIIDKSSGKHKVVNCYEKVDLPRR